MTAELHDVEAIHIGRYDLEAERYVLGAILATSAERSSRSASSPLRTSFAPSMSSCSHSCTACTGAVTS